MGLISSLGLGLLGWYYARTWARPAAAKHAAHAASQNQAEGDLPLPPLGAIEPPSVVAQVLGPKPEDPLPEIVPTTGVQPATGVPPAALPVVVKSPQQLELERRLSGAVSSNRPASAVVSSASADTPAATGAPPAAAESVPAAPPPAVEAAGRESLAARLRPTVTPAVSAKILPTQRLLLPKGAFIDCTLETAMNSSLPGMATCITATDTFGADGTVVLLERGTKLTGESQGTVQQGAARMFVLWTEARTPTGVVIPLASPGTDELGRSGLPGQVNRHFFERFGAALLITLIDGAVQREQSNGNGTVIYSPSTATDVTTEVLKSTVDIPPTIDKHQGDRIQVLVARDLDFRSVYELKSTGR
jgi:type IV secretion system protein VirB10